VRGPLQTERWPAYCLRTSLAARFRLVTVAKQRRHHMGHDPQSRPSRRHGERFGSMNLISPPGVAAQETRRHATHSNVDVPAFISPRACTFATVHVTETRRSGARAAAYAVQPVRGPSPTASGDAPRTTTKPRPCAAGRRPIGSRAASCTPRERRVASSLSARYHAENLGERSAGQSCHWQRPNHRARATTCYRCVVIAVATANSRTGNAGTWGKTSRNVPMPAR
jgi:hypothetical protein